MFDNGFINIYLILGIIVVGVIVWFISRKAAANRAAALKALADKWMFTYTLQSDTLNSDMQRFYLGSRGRAHAATNILSGSRDGMDIQLFEYYFKTGYGRSTRHYRSTIVDIQSSRLNLPAFTLRKKSVFEGIKKIFGRSKAINIQASDAFNKAYLVSAEGAEGEMVLQSLFDSEKQYFFEQRKKLNVEGNGSRLVVYREGKRPKLEELEKFLDEALEVVGVFSAEDTWSS